MRSTSRSTSLLIAAATLVGMALLTACQDEASGDNAAPSSASTKAEGEGQSADQDSAAGDSAADEDSAADDSAGGVDGGVSGTFGPGVVEYLAPNKYIVSVKGKDQQFFASEDTEVHGAGTICGEYNPKSTNRCTLDDLETSSKDGGVAATVVMKNGTATQVTEQAAPDEG
ncbi:MULTISPECIES: hypothetical protein [unclassified Streptomyces]|uniref:hypothetical protein n=1 Tax=unclassified Streptomyces TaxID=2593676 RepID=UPI00110FF37B|nr:hypothetical protein [Streptomyces sp. DASNCL29]TMU98131.1 hypothetical protein FGK60_09935 [Streptomyces sp. DASNCL29]